jgi:hypothetical protein
MILGTEIDISKISPGDKIEIKLNSNKIVNALIERASQIGCKLISLNYGEFYFKDVRPEEREKTIDYLLNC